VIKINVCLRADTNPFLAALYGRHPVRPAVRPTVDFRPTEASKAAIRYDRFTSILFSNGSRARLFFAVDALGMPAFSACSFGT
jgi:hypothetical protein